MRVRQGKIGDPFLIDDRNGLDMGAKQVLDYIFGDGNYYMVGQKPCLSWNFGPGPTKQLESYTIVDKDRKTHVLYFQKVTPECPRLKLEKAIREGEYFPDEHIFTPMQVSGTVTLDDIDDNFPDVGSIDPDINKNIMNKVETEIQLEEIEQSDAEFKADDELAARRIEREINEKLTDNKKMNKPKEKTNKPNEKRGRSKKSVDGK